MKTYRIYIGLVLSGLLLARMVTISHLWMNQIISYCAYPVILLQKMFVEQWGIWSERQATIQELREIVEHYKKQSSELYAHNIALQSYGVYEHQTRDLEAYMKRYESCYMILGQVILKHISDTGHFFLVDKGTEQGVCIDMIAVCRNCLIGRVSEVYPYYCKVVLITDHMSKVPVLGAETETHGIYEGSNKSINSLKFVSHLQPLKKGELLISSGDGCIYPQGFAVGTIKEFRVDDLGLTYEVAVDPVIRMNEISYCYIMKKGAYKAEPIHTGSSSILLQENNIIESQETETRNSSIYSE